MIIKFLRKLFGSRNDRVIGRLSKIVKKINLLENDLKLLNESDFPDKTNEYRKRINDTRGRSNS